jgi:hypothetical protein
MGETLLEKAERISKAGKQRAQDRAAERVAKASEVIHKDTDKRVRQSGKSANQIARSTKKKLESYANALQIEQFDLFPSKEYPTPFTRIPLFTPVQRQKARALHSEQTKTTDFVKLESKWDKGGVYQAGPPLTVYDEDTFIGLLHMRKKGFSGKASNMPSKRIAEGGKSINPTDESKVIVHSGYFLVTELETLIRGQKPPKKGWSGTDLKKRRESIERIGATVLRFTQPQNLDCYRGKQIQIVSVEWIGDRSDACYYFEFHPAIVAWLLAFRTYIDLSIRRQLTPFGKALHRFLSSQKSNNTYKRDWEVVLRAIGFSGRAAEAKRKAKPQMEKLVSLGFMSSGEIIGNGRSEPYVLKVSF